jgi:hypothetical protein
LPIRVQLPSAIVAPARTAALTEATATAVAEATASITDKKEKLIGFFVFVSISLAANSPLLGGYQLYFDDYTQFDKTLTQWFETRGIWRILGTMVPAWLISPDLYGPGIVLLHALGGYFFFLVARRGLDSVRHALLLTILAFSFPWGFQALLWGSAASFAFASCLLWAILCALVYFRTDGMRIYVLAPAIVFASFICLLFNEAAFFPLCLAGMIVWARQLNFLRGDKKSTLVIALAPLAGAAVWAVAYELTKPAMPVKEITNIHLPSALSALWYQYHNVDALRFWTSGTLREYGASVITRNDSLLTLAALCVVPFLLNFILRSDASSGEVSAPSSEAKMALKPFLIWMIFLALGAGAIYALAGGYSLDTRKRYLIVPFLMMTVAAAVWLILGPTRARAFWRRGAVFATTVVCIFGCLTSFFTMSIWKSELTRLNYLADVIAENGLFGDLSVDWNPDIEQIWPQSVYFWGLDREAALNDALRARGGKSIVLTTNEEQLVSWSREEQRWRIVNVNGVDAPPNQSDR